jgi:hypothetical protein
LVSDAVVNCFECDGREKSLEGIDLGARDWLVTWEEDAMI